MIHSGARLFFALVLIVAGILLLLHNLGLIDFDWSIIWATLLIAAGIAFIAAARKSASASSCHGGSWGRRTYEAVGPANGLDFSHFIGDMRVDLTRGALSGGENRVRASSFIGRIEILLPRGIEVEVDASVSLGEISALGAKKSGIGPSLSQKTAGFDAATDRLIVTSSLFLGEIEVREA